METRLNRQDPRALATVFLVILLCGHVHASESERGFGLSIGYTTLSVSRVMFEPGIADPPYQASAENWGAAIISPGAYFNHGNSEVVFDLIFSRSGHGTGLGTRPLLGGGTTSVSRSISHLGLFLGLRERVLWRLHVNTGVGFISQTASFSYNPPVMNGGGGFSEEFAAWYWGLDLKLGERVLVGTKKFEVSGADEAIAFGSGDGGIGDLSFHLTLLFQ